MVTSKRFWLGQQSSLSYSHEHLLSDGIEDNILQGVFLIVCSQIDHLHVESINILFEGFNLALPYLTSRSTFGLFSSGCVP
ncbi:hypothetical protein QYF36_001569 [Acer negundo]|nr:hypothetical protein QYF36_001569 [Acer negundo]